MVEVLRTQAGIKIVDELKTTLSESNTTATDTTATDTAGTKSGSGLFGAKKSDTTDTAGTKSGGSKKTRKYDTGTQLNEVR